MPLVFSNIRRCSHLLVAVGDVADLVPGEGALGGQPVVRLVDVQTQSIHPQKKICPLFVLYHMSKRTTTMLFSDWSAKKHLQSATGAPLEPAFICVSL